MELNAVAGREDPHTVLRRGLGVPEPQQQPSSPDARPDARDHRNRSGGMRNPGDNSGFSFSASQLRFSEGAEELTSLGQAGWAQSRSFVPKGLAPDGCGDATAVRSWGSATGGTGRPHFGVEQRGEACPENAHATSVGFEAYREHTDDGHASTWQQTPVPVMGGGGRGGSRWGAFASDRTTQGLAARQGPEKQVRAFMRRRFWGTQGGVLRAPEMGLLERPPCSFVHHVIALLSDLSSLMKDNNKLLVDTPDGNYSTMSCCFATADSPAIISLTSAAPPGTPYAVRAKPTCI